MSQCLRLVPAPESERTRFFPVVVAIWSEAKGEEVPSPRFPTAPSKKNCERPALPKRTVEEALRPPRSERAVEVALVLTPKFVVGVHEKVPEPEPQAVPVLEMVPMVLNVAQPAEPPAEETIKFVVDAVPVIVRAVEEA